MKSKQKELAGYRPLWDFERWATALHSFAQDSFLPWEVSFKLEPEPSFTISCQEVTLLWHREPPVKDENVSSYWRDKWTIRCGAIEKDFHFIGRALDWLEQEWTLDPFRGVLEREALEKLAKDLEYSLFYPLTREREDEELKAKENYEPAYHYDTTTPRKFIAQWPHFSTLRKEVPRKWRLRWSHVGLLRPRLLDNWDWLMVIHIVFFLNWFTALGFWQVGVVTAILVPIVEPPLLHFFALRAFRKSKLQQKLSPDEENKVKGVLTSRSGSWAETAG